MPQSNIYALIAIGSFVAALIVAKLAVKIMKRELPGGNLWVMYLRTLLGFLITAAIFFGYRALFSS